MKRSISKLLVDAYYQKLVTKEYRAKDSNARKELIKRDPFLIFGVGIH